jgi:hypothetical protein
MDPALKDAMARHRRQHTTTGPSRRDALGGGTLLATAVLLTGSAHFSGQVPAEATGTSSTPPTPLVFPREDWKAREPERDARVLDHAPEYVVVHHTDTRNRSDFSRKWAFELSRAIQNHHMDTQGWGDTGQQLTISRGGYVMEGRSGSLDAIRSGRHLVGVQTRDHNPVSVGIENEGRYHEKEPPEELYDSLVEVCAWLCETYDLPTSAIVGHRDLVSTTCPGDVLYDMLPALREDTDALLAAP